MPEPLTVGAPAPDFVRPASGGATVSLAGLRGKAVVVYFYPKDDTSGCTKEAIDFNRLKGAFEAAGAVVIGVSPDSVASHDKFKTKHGLDLDLAADEDKAMLEAYGVWRQKSMYGKSFMGVVRTTVLIDREGRIARIWSNVKVDGHADEALASVRAL